MWARASLIYLEAALASIGAARPDAPDVMWRITRLKDRLNLNPNGDFQ